MTKLRPRHPRVFLRLAEVLQRSWRRGEAQQQQQHQQQHQQQQQQQQQPQQQHQQQQQSQEQQQHQQHQQPQQPRPELQREAIEALEVHLENAAAMARRRPKLGERQLRIALAGHQLAMLRHETPALMAPDYVRSLFDRYAPSFDQHLLEDLGYNVPDLMIQQLQLCWEELGLRPLSMRRAVDLGAGTGLLGERLRPLAPETRLEGVDLSRQMLQKAAEKGCYDCLLLADLCDIFAPFQRASDADAAQDDADEDSAALFDLVAAADVFGYLGCLRHRFGLVRRGRRIIISSSNKKNKNNNNSNNQILPSSGALFADSLPAF
ncbi:unnamed protein product [Polarella glacialis]|uniref:Methyltransferase type 12 domain-containing protein n=1 Tax=Polarella glacialis TaxID=89957 RepID=A0A813HX35_POLGL|nr:unnamed protein product [Polarella glacialis]